MARKSGITDDSLELLLDTICNMFGGIVLIAILLAVLVQKPGKESRAESKARVTEEVAAAQAARLAVLSNEVARIEQEILEKTVNPAVATDVNAEEISQVKKEAARVLADRRAEQQAQAEVEVALKRTQRERESLDAKKTTTATRNVRVPSARLSNKSTVLALIKNGTFYPLTDMSKSGAMGRSYNEAVCSVKLAVISGQPVTLLSLRKEAQGQTIGAVATATGLLGELVSKISPTQEMVSVIVYADSFKAFNKIKDMLVAKGIGYTWVPVAMTEQIPPLVSGQTKEL